MGKRIEALYLARNMTQLDAAKALRISQPSLSDIVSGKTKTIHGKTLAMTCRVFHVTAEYVYFGVGDESDPELPLIEAELIYILRNVKADVRQSILGSARGIYNQQPGGSKPNDPFRTGKLVRK